MKIKKFAIIIGSSIAILILAFSVFGIISGFSYNFHPFFSSCVNLSEGMTKEEVSERMKDFLSNPDYTVAENGPGHYGWKNRLAYDSSLLIVLEKEPWYKLDQHPWQCEILFKDSFVAGVEPFFD